MASQKSTHRGSRSIDLTGKTFGQWTVLSFHSSSHSKNNRSATWLCRCTCGREYPVRSAHLRNGKSRMCRHCGHSTHGATGTTEYRTWEKMIRRCELPTEQQFPNYGARGIVVCERWKTSFSAFISDMGHRPSPKHSIDRKDNNGHYSCGKCKECIRREWPMNCHWATQTQQNRNTRSNRLLTHNGQTMCVSEWSEHLGFNKWVILGRLRNGWSVERALTTPVEPRKTRSK